MSISIQLLVVTVTVLSCLCEAKDFNCYVCQDCETSYNKSHITKCKSSQDKCLKLELMSGAIDRACGDKRKCAGRENPRSSRAISTAWTEELIADPPRRRTVRQLLGGKPPKKGDGTNELITLHCCNTEECNGVPGTKLSTYTLILFHIILVPLYFII